MAVFENFPYTNVHQLNLNWVVNEVIKYIQKYEDLEKFVNKSIEEQNAIIKKAEEDLAEGFDNLRQYIQENLEVIANEIINELIESGMLRIGTRYDAETEELTIVINEEV